MAEATQQENQPDNNQPFWLDAEGGRFGVTSAQSIDAGVLINTGGEVWRRLHEGPFPFWGAILYMLWLLISFRNVVYAITNQRVILQPFKRLPQYRSIPLVEQRRFRIICSHELFGAALTC